MRVIAGALKGRRIRTTEGPGYRPATGRVRESLFSMLESLGVEWPACRVADIFAGSGALGIEALSRGADSALFVELAGKAANLIRANLEELGVPRTRWRLVRADALRWLASETPLAWDLAFVDPPYGRDALSPALLRIAERGWLARGGILCAELEAGLAFDPLLPELHLLRDKLYGQTRICIWRRE